MTCYGCGPGGRGHDAEVAALRDARVLRDLKEYARRCQREGRESVAHQAIAIWATGVLDEISKLEARAALGEQP